MTETDPRYPVGKFNRPAAALTADERRELRVQIKILAQRVDFRPVVMQRAAARVGVPDEPDAKHILHFAFLPIHRRNGVGQGDELWLLAGNGHAQDEEATGGIECEDIVNIKQWRAGIFTK